LVTEKIARLAASIDGAGRLGFRGKCPPGAMNVVEIEGFLGNS
jgi:hypothetical protein